jgi:hypothetical protein
LIVIGNLDELKGTSGHKVSIDLLNKEVSKFKELIIEATFSSCFVFSNLAT